MKSEKIEQLKKEFANLTATLKAMSINDSGYQQAWDKRVDVKRRISMLENREQ